jgi:UMF1 family MFS transporter
VSEANPPVTKKEIFGWAMFDFSNSGYTTVVITAIYSSFFTEFIVGKDSAFRDTYWGMAIWISTFVALILSPLAGSICDLQGQKKKYLAMTCIVCALSTALLFFVEPGQIWTAILLVALSNTAFMLSENFCGSFLPDLATKKNMAKISGIGWAIGYFGGLVALIIVKGIITVEADQLDLFVQQHQWAMVGTAVFIVLAAIPSFILLKDRSKPVAGFENVGLVRLFKEGVKRTLETFREAKKYETLFQFLRAFVFYYAGLSATITFAGIYARRVLKFETGDLVIMFLVIQISSALGSFLFGYLERKTGIKNNILLTLVTWFISISLIVGLDPLAKALAVDPKKVFFVVSLIVGLGIGSTQSSSRALVGMLCPEGKSAEIFGLWGMFNRVAVLLSMATFAPLSDYLKSISSACVLLLFYFIVGGILLWRVDLNKGLSQKEG